MTGFLGIDLLVIAAGFLLAAFIALEPKGRR